VIDSTLSYEVGLEPTKYNGRAKDARPSKATTSKWRVLLLTFVFATAGCGQTGKKSSEIKSATNSVDNHSNQQVNWYDALIMNHIKKSDNPLIKSSRQDTAIRIEWLLDRIENSDTAKYLIFNVGHELVDEGNTNPRFVTDGWVYIDSLTRKIYEYDLPNDSLIKWEK
jgi:hypothetical protein